MLFGQSPNIIGGRNKFLTSGDAVTDGCFSLSYQEDGFCGYANGDEVGVTYLIFNASRSSGVYKDGTTTVQPHALQALPCIRY